MATATMPKKKVNPLNKVYEVWIPDPLSVNHLYFHLRSGQKIMSEKGRQYRGTAKDALVRKTFEDFKKEYIKKNGPTLIEDRGDKWYIEGTVGRIFRLARIPKFPEKTKVIIEAYAFWKDQKARDMGNLQKPIEDAFQDGGFIPNDSYILWRNMDFEFTGDPERHGLLLKIYLKKGE